MGIPAGYPSVIPYLLVRDVAAQIGFLKKGLGAKVRETVPASDGALNHAEVEIGDSRLMIGRAAGEFPPMPAMFYLYVPDADAAYRKALKAGATPVREPADQPYGDRSGGVKDAEGNQWWFGTRLSASKRTPRSRRSR